MNPPQLEISFAYSAPPAEQLPAVLRQRLAECPQLHATSPIEVSLAGRTAIVRGTVASAQDRFLAQQLLLFEPGISAVQNELRIQPAAADRARRRQPRRRCAACSLTAPLAAAGRGGGEAAGAAEELFFTGMPPLSPPIGLPDDSDWRTKLGGRSMVVLVMLRLGTPSGRFS